MPIVRMNAPHWYQREDFCLILSSPSVATWHYRLDLPTPHEWSDIFATYCYGEGSNTDVISPDIWNEIDLICQKLGVNEALVWITNLDV